MNHGLGRMERGELPLSLRLLRGSRSAALITLLLCSQGVLSKPLLYLSLYLKRNRDTYYEHL